MRLNNIDLDRVQQTIAAIRQDPAQARRPQRVAVTWNFVEGEPQMRATVTVEGRPQTLEADSPSFLGGQGLRPGPIPYCLFAFASCFAGSFAGAAAELGVRLTYLQVAAETVVDFTRPLGLGENPPAEGLTFIVEAATDGDPARLEEVKALAYRRCPAVYCITNPIPLTVQLKTPSSGS